MFMLHTLLCIHTPHCMCTITPHCYARIHHTITHCYMHIITHCYTHHHTLLRTPSHVAMHTPLYAYHQTLLCTPSHVAMHTITCCYAHHHTLLHTITHCYAHTPLYAFHHTLLYTPSHVATTKCFSLKMWQFWTIWSIGLRNFDTVVVQDILSRDWFAGSLIFILSVKGGPEFRYKRSSRVTILTGRAAKANNNSVGTIWNRPILLMHNTRPTFRIAIGHTR